MTSPRRFRKVDCSKVEYSFRKVDCSFSKVEYSFRKVDCRIRKVEYSSGRWNEVAQVGM